MREARERAGGELESALALYVSLAELLEAEGREAEALALLKDTLRGEAGTTQQPA